MSKSKQKNFRIEDRKYQDGYGLDKRKINHIDKRKERRFERDLKVKNVDSFYDEDEEEDFMKDYSRSMFKDF